MAYVPLAERNLAAVLETYSDVVPGTALEPAWDEVMAQPDNPSRTLMLGVIGAVADYLRNPA